MILVSINPVFSLSPLYVNHIRSKDIVNTPPSNPELNKMKFHHLLPLLPLIAASPTPEPDPVLPSVFESTTIPVSDTLDVASIFNLTSRSSSEGLHGPLEKRALTLDYILASVTLDGRNKGNAQPFVVSGQLLITSGISSPGTRNGKNPVEVVLKIGDPYGNPRAGNIRYVTNRYLWPYLGGRRDTSKVDFAYVSSTATQVGVTIDGNIAAANTLSVFNVRSGLTANVYNPSSGGVSIVLGSSGAVGGQVNLVGRGMISGGRGNYKAAISGRVTQRGRTTL